MSKSMFAMNTGGLRAAHFIMPRSQPVILRRSDFFRIKELSKPPNEQVALLLGMNLGFRAGEIRKAQYNHFLLEEGVVYVSDSKDKCLYPLPLDFEIASEFTKIEKRPSGYVLQRRNKWATHEGKPVGENWFWHKLKVWACEADVLNWDSLTPNHLRAFFAKEWMRNRYMVHEDPNIPLLSKMLRHRSVVYTWMYLTKFVYLEDLRKEINRFQVPIEQAFREVLTASEKTWIQRKVWLRQRVEESRGAQKLRWLRALEETERTLTEKNKTDRLIELILAAQT